MNLRDFLYGALFLPCLVWAHQEDHQYLPEDDHTHGQGAAHGKAHVHGEAQLDVAIQAQMVYIEFKSPAANIVGFEHAPKNSAQRSLLEDAAHALAKPDNLFQFGDASCSQQKVRVRMPHSGGEREDPVPHSSIYASYQFACDDLTRLNDVMVELFSHFPEVHKISVQWITPSGQGVKSLTAKANKFQMTN